MTWGEAADVWQKKGLFNPERKTCQTVESYQLCWLVLRGACVREMISFILYHEKQVLVLWLSSGSPLRGHIFTLMCFLFLLSTARWDTWAVRGRDAGFLRWWTLVDQGRRSQSWAQTPSFTWSANGSQPTGDNILVDRFVLTFEHYTISRHSCAGVTVKTGKTRRAVTVWKSKKMTCIVVAICLFT